MGREVRPIAVDLDIEWESDIHNLKPIEFYLLEDKLISDLKIQNNVRLTFIAKLKAIIFRR